MYRRYLFDFPVSLFLTSGVHVLDHRFLQEKVYVVQSSSGYRAMHPHGHRPWPPSAPIPPAVPAPLPPSPDGTLAGSRFDTSRMHVALARARIMGARYPFYLLADFREGQLNQYVHRAEFEPATRASARASSRPARAAHHAQVHR